MKQCTVCNETKPTTEFYKAHAKCKPCYREHYGDKQRDNDRKFKASPKGKRQAERERAAKYGLTVKELRLMPDQCEVCNTTHNLCVDHCHDTSDVRGILCKRCNSALGFLNDSRTQVQALLEYMSKG